MSVGPRPQNDESRGVSASFPATANFDSEEVTHFYESNNPSPYEGVKRMQQALSRDTSADLPITANRTMRDNNPFYAANDPEQFSND